jgi:hypothetical protein
MKKPEKVYARAARRPAEGTPPLLRFSHNIPIPPHHQWTAQYRMNPSAVSVTANAMRIAAGFNVGWWGSAWKGYPQLV